MVYRLGIDFRIDCYACHHLKEKNARFNGLINGKVCRQLTGSSDFTMKWLLLVNW